MKRRRLLGGLLWALLVGSLTPAAAADAAPTVLLDPGHTPQQPGAASVWGGHEVDYNDRFVAKLAAALRAAGITVALTREPGQALSLADRAATANREQPALFLSIHHDSAQLAFLKRSEAALGTGYQTTRPIAGYSIFVSKTNPRFADSYRFAALLGTHLLSLGRPPSLHHAEPIAGENRELLDRRLGIYRFDDLVVLAKTTVPAALLEVGVIVDSGDERYVAAASNQDAMCRAIVDAVRAFFAGEAPVSGGTGQ